MTFVVEIFNVSIVTVNVFENIDQLIRIKRQTPCMDSLCVYKPRLYKCLIHRLIVGLLDSPIYNGLWDSNIHRVYWSPRATHAWS